MVKPGKMTDEKLRLGIELCFDNSDRLLQDARILLENSSYGHARFLVLSAIEEVSKAFMYAISRAEAYETKELRDDVISHSMKLGYFFFFIGAMEKPKKERREKVNRPLDIEDFRELGKGLEKLNREFLECRVQSLYVDYIKGKWFSPFEVSRVDTKLWIEYAEKYKKIIEGMCKNILTAPKHIIIEYARNWKQFLETIESNLLPFFEHCYKNNVITKAVYDTILKNIKEKT
jgi:AbiV family abortive infection protein